VQHDVAESSSDAVAAPASLGTIAAAMENEAMLLGGTSSAVAQAARDSERANDQADSVDVS